MELVANLALLLAVAWVVRALLAAHEVTWRRMIVAVVVGASLGATLAAFLVVDMGALAVDPTGTDVKTGEVLALALPFQVIATMVVVVAFELVSATPPRRRELRPVRPWRAVRRRVAIGLRMLQVTRIATRHGLAPVLGLKREQVSTREPVELARRARVALEEAGGMFVKLGQLLATRPDLLPPAALVELGRLHSSARPLPRGEVEGALASEVGSVEEAFSQFEWEPLGSASIAQAHLARLPDGKEVVVKIRRPGLEDVVERDLAITMWLARIVERRTSWGRAFGVVGLAEEFAAALRAELDFRVEARAAIDMGRAVAGYPRIRVPQIVERYTSDRVLVMERLVGTTLSATPQSELPEDPRARRRALRLPGWGDAPGRAVPRRSASRQRDSAGRRAARPDRLRGHRQARRLRAGVDVPDARRHRAARAGAAL